MRLKAVSPTTDCSYHAFQAFAPSVPSSLLTSSFRLRNPELDGPVSLVLLSNPFSPKTLLKSRSFNKTSRGNAIRRSCSLNLDGVFRDESWFHVGGSANSSGGGANSREEEGHRNKKLHCAISKNSPFLGKQGRDQDSFLNTRFDFLEPMMLGIRPEFPDWPDQETATWATIEQKAKSLDIPLSLRMIKKKLQWEEGFTDSKESESESGYCSVKAAFASMVFIIVELQSCALHMRETLCHEDLEVITSKVQKDMHSSFVWLFQQVFSRTPALMLHVMLLLANFGVHSASHNAAIAEASFMEPSINALSAEQRQIQQYQQINSTLSSLVTENGNGGAVEEKTEAGNLPQSSEHLSIYPSDQLGSVAEMNLWSSMVDDATKMGEGVDDEVVDHDTMQQFVSPVSVELEPDTYEDFLRTDLLYQMNLSQEPNNPLLLCNYAQFLHLVAHDYHRAEECFKRAVQVMPLDAESLTQYANFLWTVRKDYWAAEESFLQALALEPDNAYYASRYANFLWNTGGEETCFPLNNSHNPNV
ncbi:hypothetical protein C2S51_014454 [Perilla frutescens var. frutescens]|nr:hypothetical protein C2S51_014454 [Perilla frutescens var. frutescens]